MNPKRWERAKWLMGSGTFSWGKKAWFREHDKCGEVAGQSLGACSAAATDTRLLAWVLDTWAVFSWLSSLSSGRGLPWERRWPRTRTERVRGDRREEGQVITLLEAVSCLWNKLIFQNSTWRLALQNCGWRFSFYGHFYQSVNSHLAISYRLTCQHLLTFLDILLVTPKI